MSRKKQTSVTPATPRVGRPTKLNAETQKKVCDAILVGATYEAAAQYAGITYETFNEWMKAGRAAAAPNAFSEFSEAVDRANAEAQVFFAMNIKDAARGGDWRAAAWMLERRFPKDYGAVTKAELTGRDGAPIEVRDMEAVRALRWKQVAPALAAAAAETGDE